MHVCQLCSEETKWLVCCDRGCKLWVCLRCWGGSLLDHLKCIVCEYNEGGK